eukprot:3463848-Prymnesium_polylepis.1
MPEGWLVAVDETTGEKYYYNALTGDSSWERPAPPPPTDRWVEEVDPRSGRTYYVNASTNERTWTKPPGYVPLETTPTRSPGKRMAKRFSLTTSTILATRAFAGT